jgi:integrase
MPEPASPGLQPYASEWRKAQPEKNSPTVSHTTGTLTCATLLLQASVLIKVVQERLGHKRIEMTLNIYAHALPSMQQDAAAKLAALLHS